VQIRVDCLLKYEADASTKCQEISKDCDTGLHLHPPFFVTQTTVWNESRGLPNRIGGSIQIVKEAYKFTVGDPVEKFSRSMGLETLTVNL
jgi:hypothetical protein